MSQARHTRPADPGQPPARLYTAAQTRALDRQAIDAGTDGFDLMCRAGKAAFKALRQHWPKAQRLLVLCGAGNNAGDGYVVAALAARAGLQARIVALKSPQELKHEAAAAVSMAQAEQVPVEQGITALESATDADVVVDALLGTGAKGAPRGSYADAIEWINAQPAGVLSIDIPSGVNADTGQYDTAVSADLTISFIGRKFGLYTGLAADVGGQRLFDDLGLEDALMDQVDCCGRLLDDSIISRCLPPRLPSSHKGHTGHLLVVGGAPGYGGSCIMLSEAAARSGAGLVSLATDAAHLAPALARCPVLMVRGVRSGLEIQDLLESARGVAVGPGLGQGAWGEGLLLAVLEAGLPSVVDADGLHLLKRCHPTLKRDDWILTPHPGEAAALLGISAAEVQADRLGAAQALWQQRGGVIVLKGNGTLIVDGADDQHCAVCPLGNPGMASGGMGDVLGGIIGGLLVQGLAPVDAARAGVYIHALAADKAALALGERGLMATDLASFVHSIVNP